MKANLTHFEVKDLQRQIVVLGGSLPRWGVDGCLGDETLRAVAHVLGYDEPRTELDVSEVDALNKAFIESIGQFDDHDSVKDARGIAFLKRGKPKKRPIEVVDTIVLHQMACMGSTGIQRWLGLDCHWVVTRDTPMAFLLHDVEDLMWHAHGFNARSVGVETEGYFSGIETDPKYFWKPEKSKNEPMDFPEHQANAARMAVIATINIVRQMGGKVLYIGAHRQSYAAKESDPGSLIWKAVGVWAQNEFGLLEAPTLPAGSPIPEAWDEHHVGVPYRKPKP